MSDRISKQSNRRILAFFGIVCLLAIAVGLGLLWSLRSFPARPILTGPAMPKPVKAPKPASDAGAWAALRAEFQAKSAEIQKTGREPQAADFRPLTADERDLLRRAVKARIEYEDEKVGFRGQVVDELTGKPIPNATLRMAIPRGGALDGRMEYKQEALGADGTFDLKLPLSVQVQFSAPGYDDWSANSDGQVVERAFVATDTIRDLEKEVDRLVPQLGDPRNEWDDLMLGRRIALYPLSKFVPLDVRRTALHFDAKENRPVTIFRYRPDDRPAKLPLFESSWDWAKQPFQAGVADLPRPLSPDEVSQQAKANPPAKDLPERIVRELAAMGYNAGDLGSGIVMVVETKGGKIAMSYKPALDKAIQDLWVQAGERKTKNGEDAVYWDIRNRIEQLIPLSEKERKIRRNAYCDFRYGLYINRIRLVALGNGDGFVVPPESQLKRGPDAPSWDRQLCTAPTSGYAKEWVLTGEDLGAAMDRFREKFAYVRLGGKYGRVQVCAGIDMGEQGMPGFCKETALLRHQDPAVFKPDLASYGGVDQSANVQPYYCAPDGSLAGVSFTFYMQPDGTVNLRSRGYDGNRN